MSALRRSAVAVAACAVAFAILAVLVVSGSLTALDRYAAQHWMPHAKPGGTSVPLVSVSQLYPNVGGLLDGFCNIWTFPGSPLVSGLLLLACGAVLVRRGEPATALAWAAAWVALNVVEVLGKSVLHRPTLYIVRHGVSGPLHSFDSSFPSGHAMRGVVAAALVVAVWRRALWPALVWVAVALPALVVSAAHTPSDVLGGVLLAAMAPLAIEALRTAAPPRVRAVSLKAAILEEG